MLRTYLDDRVGVVQHQQKRPPFGQVFRASMTHDEQSVTKWRCGLGTETFDEVRLPTIPTLHYDESAYRNKLESLILLDMKLDLQRTSV